WIASLGAIAHALVAVLLLLAVNLATRSSTADKAGSGDRHRGFRENVTGKGSTSERDGCTRENRSHEGRIRHGRGLSDPPIDVARRSAAGHHYCETGARERASPSGPDLEDPAPARRPIERERAGHGRGGVKAVDAWRENEACERAGQRGIARDGRIRGVGGVEVSHDLSRDRRDD